MEKTFESSLKELERIVGKLENGDLPLEESLKLFEEGVKLSRECRERLNNAEQRIEILLKDENGRLRLENLPTGTPSDGSGNPSKRITFETDDSPD